MNAPNLAPPSGQRCNYPCKKRPWRGTLKKYDVSMGCEFYFGSTFLWVAVSAQRPDCEPDLQAIDLSSFLLSLAVDSRAYFLNQLFRLND